MNITLVLNPRAGHGAPTLDELCRTIQNAGHRVEVRQAKRAEVRNALDELGDLVVAAGGDGTVSRVMKVLAGRGVPLAILPLGTANNIATSLGISGTASELAATWSRETIRRVDIGMARGPWGERLFVESVGIGLLGHLLRPEVGDALDDTDAARGAARRLARTLTARSRRVELDGQDVSGQYLLLEAMNIRCAGPNLWLAEQARAGDGKLEIVMATETDRATLVALADAFGTSRASLPAKRGRHLRIWCEPDELHVDDEHGRELGVWQGPAAVDVELAGAWVDVVM